MSEEGWALDSLEDCAVVIEELRAENRQLRKDLEIWRRNGGDVLLTAEIERLRLYIKDLQINSPAQAALDEIERLRNAIRKHRNSPAGHDADIELWNTVEG